MTTKDYFCSRDGALFAGTHLLIDVWGCKNLDSIQYIEESLVEMTRAAGATLLKINLHHFQPNGGVTGVALLAESHISVHTWPEVGFAAFDIFMCGNSKIQEALSVLKERFTPKECYVTEQLRGSCAEEFKLAS